MLSLSHLGIGLPTSNASTSDQPFLGRWFAQFFILSLYSPTSQEHSFVVCAYLCFWWAQWRVVAACGEGGSQGYCETTSNSWNIAPAEPPGSRCLQRGARKPCFRVVWPCSGVVCGSPCLLCSPLPSERFSPCVFSKRSLPWPSLIHKDYYYVYLFCFPEVSQRLLLRR